jgi:hypothetical protein
LINQQIDRCSKEVSSQLTAMRCNQFEIKMSNQYGQMINRIWTIQKVLNIKTLAFLRYENVGNTDIYIKPAFDTNQGIILIDNLRLDKLKKIKEEGLEPAVVIETSPRNYQAWIRLTDDSLNQEIITEVNKLIAQQFTHQFKNWNYGRLAGFTNRKSNCRRIDGKYPWVTCVDATGQTARYGSKLIRQAIEIIERKYTIIETEN